MTKGTTKEDLDKERNDSFNLSSGASEASIDTTDVIPQMQSDLRCALVQGQHSGYGTDAISAL